jgi:hypothetical protein
VKIRQKIAALVVATLAATGLALLAPQDAAQAYPLTGTHTIVDKCDDGTFHAQMSFNYSITFDHYDNVSKWNIYRFQMNSATYTGSANATGRNTAWVTMDGSANGSIWLNATSGGAAGTLNADAVFPSGTANAPSSTRVNGLAGVAWSGVTIDMSTEGVMKENMFKAVWSTHTVCATDYDLSDPNGPQLGTVAAGLDCIAGGAPDTLSLTYTISSVSNDAYTIKINSTTAVTYSGTPTTATTDYHVDVVDSTGTAISLDPTPPFANSIPPVGIPQSVTLTDGVGGVTFPSKTFNYIGGDAPKPFLRAKFIRDGNHIGGNDPADDCTSTYNLTSVWNTTVGSNPAFETIALDDCSTIPATIQIHPIWEKDSTGRYYRVKSLSIYQSNSSGSKVVLDAGTATILGGVTVSELGFPAKDLVTIGSGSPIAERTITSGETQIIPVASPNKWVKVSADPGHSNAPTSFNVTRQQVPHDHNSREGLQLDRCECIPSNPPGSGSIAELDYQPSDL